MSTDAQIAANIENARSSTGPRTSPGKSIASNNAVKSGLFCKRDFVRPEEQGEYAELRAGLLNDLAPESTLEAALAAEIVSATWRLRRCSVVEGKMADQCLFDPMEDIEASRIQTSVDRARAHAHNILRRTLADLRRIQTDRAIKVEVATADPEPKSVLVSFKEMVSVVGRNEDLRRKFDRSAAQSYVDYCTAPIDPLLSQSQAA